MTSLQQQLHAQWGWMSCCAHRTDDSIIVTAKGKADTVASHHLQELDSLVMQEGATWPGCA